VSGLLTAVRRLTGAIRTGTPGLAMTVLAVGTDLGADHLQLYLVDYEQTMLSAHPLPGAQLPIEGTVAGDTYMTGRPRSTHESGVHYTWLPLVDGSNRLGVLEIRAAAAATPELLEEYETVATLLAQLIVTRRHYGDALERTRRRLPMQLAAEIVWNQLPPSTFTTADVAISGILEPCYDVGGDAFDYASDDGTLHVALFDTIGHGISATAVTAMTVSAYRNARRLGLNLVDTYRSIDTWIASQYPGSFVTAILGELDVRTGTYRRISAGHPAELLLRGGRLVRQLTAPTGTPLGLGRMVDALPEVETTPLQPGDTLLLYTDGVVEARTDDGVFFGVDRLASFVLHALAERLPPPETMRRLIQAILAHQHEQLQDDATAVLLQWRPTVG
jgi:sigma-B regulation protein RsbU (phosphoserine phosphatase)